jgi:hypothetical protein
MPTTWVSAMAEKSMPISAGPASNTLLAWSEITYGMRTGCPLRDSVSGNGHTSSRSRCSGNKQQQQQQQQPG